MQNYYWINRPFEFQETTDGLMIQTQPHTDMWGKTHYGFSKSNAPLYLTKTNKTSFTYEVQTKFISNYLYDQCGVIVYLNKNYWAKFSSEYENSEFQRLGGVVTKNGYSDWSTQDISAKIKQVFYRITREKNDFIVEYSLDSQHFHQMRIFNLIDGEPMNSISLGLYACSPQGQGFKAYFKNPHFL